MTRTLRAALLAVLLTAFAAPNAGATSRIKDLANIEGVRQNQLIGYGLVVGLNGTGDTLNNIPFTKQSLTAMLERLGVNIRGQTLRTGNVAAVMVTANLPPFGTQGTRIDIVVSALGDSKSLQGGVLQRQRAVEALERLVIAAERAQRRASIVVRLDVIRLDGNRLAATLQRFLVASERGERGAPIIMRLGKFGFQLDRLVEALDRLRIALERFEDQTVVEQDLRRRLARAHGRRDQAQGLGRLAGRKLDQPHHLQGVEVIRPDRENGGVKPFGLGQTPLLMQLERLREGLRNVQRLKVWQRLRHALPPAEG
jgi:hypothetical protein